MNKMSLKWLYQQLPVLVEKGVLTQESADKIHQFYGEIKSSSRMGIGLIVFGSVGALLIGLGIISLFAHNWEQLSRLYRAIFSLLPLLIGQIMALWVLLRKPKSSAFKEGAATFLSLMVGAAIALISQTYNINADAGTFTLTWMLLILPLVYFMQASLTAAIYLIGITVWSANSWDNATKAFLFWPLAAVIIPHFIWSLKHEIYALRATLVSLVMAVCVLFAAGFSLGRGWPGLWVIIYPGIFAIIYFIGAERFNQITTNWQKPLRFIGALGLFILAFQFTFSYCWKYLVSYAYSINKDKSWVDLFPDYAITLAIIGIALLLLYDNFKRRNTLIALFGSVPLLAIIGYFFSIHSVIIPVFIFNIFLLTLSLSRIIAGFRCNNLSLINTWLFILAALIIARFFDSDISFIIKGLVFIAVGIGFLVTNLIYSRRLGGAK